MEVVIVGAGGHGRVVLDILRAEGRYEPVGFVDADYGLTDTMVDNLPVFGTLNVLPKLRQQRLIRAIIAIGNNRTRARYAALLRAEGFTLANAIHPSASVSRTAELGENVVVAAQAAVCTGCKIADGVIINTGAIVDHECEVDEAAHVCPGARLAGRVRIGAAAFIGLGASVLQCLSIGKEAIIGAGAVVIQDVAPFATAVGMPARVIRIASPAERAGVEPAMATGGR